MTTGQKTAAELEREVEAQRAGVAHTLDAISSRLTPGQILDEAWELARETGGGAFARNLGSSVRDNPLPVGLITAGIAWLMSGRGGGLPRMARNSGSRLRDAELPSKPLDTTYDGYAGSGKTGGPPSEKGDSFVAKAAGSVSSATSAARDSLGRSARAAGDVAGVAFDDVRDSAGRLSRSASESARQLRDGAGRLSQSASESARQLRDRTVETSRQVRQRAETLADEQPVVLAVAGLALGALVGAIARSTAAESRLMGEASDGLKERARDAASSGAEKIVGAVERTYEAVRQEAENEGLTASSLRDAADDVSQKVRKVARTAKTKLDEELGTAPGTAQGG